MMKDPYGRSITYLRISVTDRCNLRCRYCMPATGVHLVNHADILTYDQIVDIASQAVSMGIDKIRLTGGEPLVRRDVVNLVAKLAAMEGIRDLSMTTNAILLEEHARKLADAGLMRVNVSLDTTDPQKYAYITRGGDIQQAFRGIQAAKQAGLLPIKLNCVIQASSKEPDAQKVRQFAKENHLEVRYIKVMDYAAGIFSIVQGGQGGDCARCNRLRLSATGIVRPCLFSDTGFSIKKMGIGPALSRAVENKPEKGGPCKENWIRATGG